MENWEQELPFLRGGFICQQRSGQGSESAGLALRGRPWAERQAAALTRARASRVQSHRTEFATCISETLLIPSVSAKVANSL